VTNAVKHFRFTQRGKRRLTRSRTHSRSGHAGPGSTRRSRLSSRTSSCCWERPRPRL
jgi:hypothetical protein